jgi:hypothetical protein
MASNRQIAGLEVLISANANKLREALGQGVSALNQFQKQAQNVQRILGGLGIGIGLFQLGSAVRDAVNVFKEFEFKMSEVRAITNATDKEFKALSEDAIRLGRSTVFTARQVGGLQVAYGRLGFTTKEILNATEATLNLAAATNIDLSDAADVAGSTVRGFQLDASETIRVTDVMTASFNKSALSVDAFRESMKFVAPIAQAANASVEETTALLGVLANAGIKGSIAGTSLRRIFSDLTRDGRPLRERLQELADKGLTLAGAYDEIGRVAQTSLLVLAKNTGQIDNLTEALNNAAGEAERVANIRLNNLEGDVIRLTSATEGFILSVQNSEIYRSFIQALTRDFNLFTGQVNSVTTSLQLVTKALRDGDPRLREYIQLLSDSRRETGKPVDEIFVTSVAREAKLTNEQLEKLLSLVQQINKEFTPKEQAIFDFTKFLNSQQIFINNLDRTKQGYDKLNSTVNDYINSLRAQVSAEFRAKKEVQNVATQGELDGYDARIKATQETIKVVTEYYDNIRKQFPKAINAIEGEIFSLENLKGIREDLQKRFNENVDQGDEKQKVALGNEIRRVDEAIREWEAYAKTVKEAKDQAGKDPLEGKFRFIIPEDAGFVADDVINQREANLLIDRIAEINAGLDLINTDRKINIDVDTSALEEVAPKIAEEADKITREVNIFASAFSGIGEAIGNAIAGVDNLANALLKTIADFGSQLGGLMIALGVAKLQFDLFKSGPALIAAGVALVAASQAVKASIAKRPSLSGSAGGGGSTGGSSSFAFAQDSAPVRLVSDVQIRGQDLYVVLSNYEKNNRNTRNG